MNMKKKIEQYLKAAPKPPAPDGLLDKLQADVSTGDIKIQRSALRRWFAPSGGSISPWRVAAAVAIAFLVLLPLSYGATKAVKHFIVFEFVETFEFPEDNAMVGVGVAVATNDPNFTEEDAQRIRAEQRELLKKQLDEIRELRKAGKFERTYREVVEINGVLHRLYEDSFTLSNGKVIKMGSGEPIIDEDDYED